MFVSEGKRIGFILLRHTMALEMLQGGVDRAVIALWLGHESVETTQIYLGATLVTKQQALAKTTLPETQQRMFRAEDQLLCFLNNLKEGHALCRVQTPLSDGLIQRHDSFNGVALHSLGRDIVLKIVHSDRSKSFRTRSPEFACIAL
jgi:hypothetical protein